MAGAFYVGAENLVQPATDEAYAGRLARLIEDSDERAKCGNSLKARYHAEFDGRKLTQDETERIWQICDSALELQRVAFLFGESQIGKTEALQAYAESHNHGSTIYVSVPTGGFLTHFLARLADALRISHRMKQGELRQRIIQAFDSRMLLIVDDAQGFSGAGGGQEGIDDVGGLGAGLEEPVKSAGAHDGGAGGVAE